ncbi:MAG: hypothetical protein IPG66_11820 [Hydrogenophilales bacterium]|nr:hypothetical protein [Hydrogenophilales bacterium]
MTDARVEDRIRDVQSSALNASRPREFKILIAHEFEMSLASAQAKVDKQRELVHWMQIEYDALMGLAVFGRGNGINRAEKRNYLEAERVRLADYEAAVRGAEAIGKELGLTEGGN